MVRSRVRSSFAGWICGRITGQKLFKNNGGESLGDFVRSEATLAPGTASSFLLKGE
jgi:hypothetical protein